MKFEVQGTCEKLIFEGDKLLDFSCKGRVFRFYRAYAHEWIYHNTNTQAVQLQIFKNAYAMYQYFDTKPSTFGYRALLTMPKFIDDIIELKGEEFYKNIVIKEGDDDTNTTR